MTDPSQDAFEAFPRQRLALKWSRRQLLAALSTERRVVSAQRRGGTAYKLPDLGTLPDDLLELLTPVVVAGSRIVEDQGAFWGTPGAGGPRVRLFSAASVAASALAHFDGSAPLGVIAARLAGQTGWDPYRSFAYTRGLFLHLVSWGFCLPKP